MAPGQSGAISFLPSVVEFYGAHPNSHEHGTCNNRRFFITVWIGHRGWRRLPALQRRDRQATPQHGRLRLPLSRD